MNTTAEDLRVAKKIVADELAAVCRSYGWEFTDIDTADLIIAIASVRVAERENAATKCDAIAEDAASRLGLVNNNIAFENGRQKAAKECAAVIRAGDKE